jgi:hypothetical protein
VARVYMRQTRAGQGGPLALVSMHQGRSLRRGVGTRAIMMPPGPGRPAALAANLKLVAGTNGHSRQPWHPPQVKQGPLK